MDERAVAITLGGERHELLLTTRATKEISKRYGGLDGLGTKLSGSIDMVMEEIAWIIALLANQTRQIYNLRHPADPKPLLSPEEVELLTTPADLAVYQNALTEVLAKGSQRHIRSQEESGPNGMNG